MKDTPTHAPTNKPTQNQFTNSELEQIEGMAKVICGNNRDCKNCGHNSGIKECGCIFYAKRLYEQSYRKQSAVAAEIFAEIEKIGVLRKVIKGGEIIFDITSEYDELKKKYTEEQTNG